MEKVLTHLRVNQKQGKKHGEALNPWVEMPRSRLECSLALKKFLEYAVAEHRQPEGVPGAPDGLSKDPRRRWQEQEEGCAHG